MIASKMLHMHTNKIKELRVLSTQNLSHSDGKKLSTQNLYAKSGLSTQSLSHPDGGECAESVTIAPLIHAEFVRTGFRHCWDFAVAHQQIQWVRDVIHAESVTPLTPPDRNTDRFFTDRIFLSLGRAETPYLAASLAVEAKERAMRASKNHRVGGGNV